MKLADGLVGIADTCVLSGSEVVVARRVNVYENQKGVAGFDYSQMRLASFLDLRYSTISRIIAITTRTAKVKDP